MQLVDSHCHLGAGGFDADRDAVVERARQVGVSRMVVPVLHYRNVRHLMRLIEAYPVVYGAVGVYPRRCDGWCTADVEGVRLAAHQPRVVAIGEIGLDYSFNNRNAPDVQKRAFADQLEVAVELGLPAIVHNHFNTFADCLDVIAGSRIARRDRAGVLHHFNGDYGTARRALDLGLYLSFTGVVTYPNARKMPELVKRLPAERLLAETDAPALPPHPYRKQRNEPAYLCLIVKSLAAIRGRSYEEMAAVTTENAERLFRLTAW